MAILILYVYIVVLGFGSRSPNQSELNFLFMHLVIERTTQANLNFGIINGYTSLSCAH